MRLIVYLLTAAATFYMAGMYKSYPLMLLFVMELVLMVAMRILPHYLKRAFSLEFANQRIVSERGAEAVCLLYAKNRARLPISRFRVKLSLCYHQGGRQITGKLYGGVKERGEDEMEFWLALPYCGLVLLELEKADVYDYLSMFSSGKRLSGELEAAVFPGERALMIELSAAYQGYGMSGEQATLFRGKEQQQIRQLREYREGDSIRLVHWNQSARTEKLWVKEYESEEEICVEVFVDLTVSGKVRAERVHAFYELLSALVLGLLGHAALVRLCWQEGQALFYASVRGREELWDTLLHFYQMDFPVKPKRRKRDVQKPPIDGDFLIFNMELELYCRERFIHRFSRKDFEKEIESGNYVI